jgi:acetyltransferase-like isoleucine patch superfamily enzyme
MKIILRRVLRSIYTRLAKRSVGSCAGLLVANGFTKLTRNTHLGENVHFNGMEISGRGKVTIGNNFHSGPECLIITSFHNYDTGNAIPYDDTYISKDVTIGDNVWLGSRVIILGGVTLGEGAIIQAGAVVVRDIAPLAIAGGNPAVAFKMREAAHYETLKAQGRFH